MTGPLPGRDAQEVDALVTDRYLEALLAAHARGADVAPAADRPAPDIARAADRLARDLLRLHPSFRFEEALAARLADAAARMRLAAAAGAEGSVIAMPARGGPVTPFPGPDADADAAEAGRPAFGRPLLIGGALTSAALSIAGAAYVAWRLNRTPADPMARAVRAIARSRLA